MKNNMRKILVGAVAIIVLAVIFMRGDQLDDLIKTIHEGTPIFLVLAVLFQLGKYATQGSQFVWCFRSVGENLRYLEGVKLVFGTFFVNTVAPSLNLAGTTLVVDDASKRGVPAGRSTAAALLMQLSIDTGFLIILTLGFAVVGLTVGLQPGWLLLGLVAVAVVGGLLFVIIMGGKRPQLVLKVLKPIERLADKVMRRFKKGPIDPWAERTIESFSRAAKLMAKNPRRTASTFGLAIGASLCELGCFAMTGISFGIHDPAALVCGYVLATLTAMVSFIPQGIGLVEAAVLLGFTLFGINQATGMAVIMVYRAIVFWIPFLAGAILIQRTRAFTGVKVNMASPVAEAPAVSAADSVKKSVAATSKADDNAKPDQQTNANAGAACEAATPKAEGPAHGQTDANTKGTTSHTP